MTTFRQNMAQPSFFRRNYFRTQITFIFRKRLSSSNFNIFIIQFHSIIFSIYSFKANVRARNISSNY